MKKTINFTFLSLFLILLVSTYSHAASYDYGFDKISDNGGVALPEGQLYVSIGDETLDGVNGVSFTFYNLVGIESSITEVVFGDKDQILSNGTSTTIAKVGSSDDVNFTDSAKANGDDYTFTKVLQSNADQGINDGVNASGDWIKFFGTYSNNTSGTSFTFDDLAQSIIDKDFNIGLHVQGIPLLIPTNDDASERYILVDKNGPGPGGFGNPVPLPAALWLFGPALLGFMGFRRKTKS